ncbi:MAG: class I adenylate-forming enzyme family protein [Aestuariivita sp.]|nr:class I adenylate-forming enzyme family protein [Aestuariivita sp.]
MIRTDLIAPISELLSFHATNTPDKMAFEDASRTVTYAQLERETRNLAIQFCAQGLKAGDRVGIWLSNSVDWVVSVLAVIRSGGVAVPISIDSTPDEVAYRLTDAGISILILASDCRSTLGEIQRNHGVSAQVSIIAGDVPDASLTLTDLQQTDGGALSTEDIDAISLMVYTSGTTGQPKGVQLTMRSMLWVNAACWNPILGMGPDDVILSPLPLYHSYALNFCVISIVANGASEHIMEKFSTDLVFELLATGRFTLLPGVPSIFYYIMIKAKGFRINPFRTLRRCCSAGAILPATLNAEFESLFGIELLDGYGITETSTMVTMNWPNSKRVPGSCGLPLVGLSVRLIDPATGFDVSPGLEGELICRGPNLMQGYLNKPEATSKALKNGWYHTGDLARMDVNGFITITGRLKELIIRGGQNIAPAEVEETISQMDDVLDCAVTGVAHETLGEVPVAFVVTDGERVLTIETVRAFCQDRLSAYKLPDDLKIVTNIPRTGSGKIVRFKLRELYEADAGHEQRTGA